MMNRVGVGETSTFLGDPFRSQLPKDFSMLVCLWVQKMAKLMKSRKLPGDFGFLVTPPPRQHA